MEAVEVRGGFEAGRFSADLCSGCAEQCFQVLRKRLKESAEIYKKIRK